MATNSAINERESSHAPERQPDWHKREHDAINARLGRIERLLWSALAGGGSVGLLVLDVLPW